MINWSQVATRVSFWWRKLLVRLGVRSEGGLSNHVHEDVYCAVFDAVGQDVYRDVDVIISYVVHGAVDGAVSLHVNVCDPVRVETLDLLQSMGRDS